MRSPLTRNGAWFLAVRPKTLPAAAAPVCIGIALAVKAGGFHPVAAAAALMVALLLQIGVNLANDYFDFKSGIDDCDRKGPVRVTQAGLIPPHRVRNAMLLCFTAATCVGAYLMARGGLPVAVIGLISILSALAYSAGPYPIASNGLGEVFAFLFFGPVAVCGTYYVQALALSWPALAGSIPPGLLIAAIMVINNLRDIATDRAAGKHTLAVKIGPARTIGFYISLLLSSFFLLPVMGGTGLMPWGVLVAVLSFPMAAMLIRETARVTGEELNRTLAGTARLGLMFSLLFSLGLFIG
ncbi:MAG: 1,4-dihydroxy-2-naphthoate polyprenyltransferase [Desulfobacteraceae bacterium]|nr:1,4-dihydroxy-2-naphthoate polyprenyltransferase [Desulfobacteraceae bacterium]